MQIEESYTGTEFQASEQTCIVTRFTWVLSFLVSFQVFFLFLGCLSLHLNHFTLDPMVIFHQSFRT